MLTDKVIRKRDQIFRLADRSSVLNNRLSKRVPTFFLATCTSFDSAIQKKKRVTLVLVPGHSCTKGNKMPG